MKNKLSVSLIYLDRQIISMMGYRFKLEPLNQSEIKTRRDYNTKKKKMSNFNNIWEEVRNSSEEPDRLTLIRGLQSHIKQVVGETPDAR
jgi:hypothetical protein